MDKIDTLVSELKGVLGDKLETELSKVLKTAEAENNSGNAELSGLVAAAIARLKDAKKTEEVLTRLELLTKAVENLNGALSTKVQGVSSAVSDQTKELLENLAKESIHVRNLNEIDFSQVAKHLPKEFNAKILGIVKTIDVGPSDTSFDYDINGRTRRIVETFQGYVITTTMTYNSLGLITRITEEVS